MISARVATVSAILLTKCTDMEKLHYPNYFQLFRLKYCCTCTTNCGILVCVWCTIRALFSSCLTLRKSHSLHASAQTLQRADLLTTVIMLFLSSIRSTKHVQSHAHIRQYFPFIDSATNLSIYSSVCSPTHTFFLIHL